MRKKSNTKIIGGLIVIAAISALIWTLFVAINKTSKNVAEITDPEILRSISYGEITDADKKIQGCDYVEFSAFYTRDLNGDGYAEKVKGSCREISQTDTMYAELNVLTQGSLRDAKITVNGENFVWQTAIVEDQIVKGDYIGETSEITLQPILNPGSQKLLWGTIKSNVGENVNNYSKVSSVTLTGKYYDEDGNFVCDINQTRYVTVDWYGETKTEVNKYYYSLAKDNSYENQVFDIAGVVKEDSIELAFRVAASETNQRLLLKEQSIEITIPQLNGYDATEVRVIDDNAQSVYEDGKLTITKTSEVDDEGNITKSIARSCLYTVVVKYPVEAYDQISADSIVVSIPVKATTKGYNNQNNEFENPHISTSEGIITATYSKPSGNIWNIYTSVGDNERVAETNICRYQVSKEIPTDIFNGNIYEDKTTRYPVKWEIVIGDYTAIDKIELKEGKKNSEQKSDEFLDSRNTYTSMRELETTTGVYFSNARQTLGDDGWIKLYNVENGEEEASLLETFTKDNWDSYTKDNPYVVNTKSIKVVTSNPVRNTTFSVIQIKELDDKKITEDFSEEEFERFSYIYTNLKGTIEAPEGITYENGETISSIYRDDYAYYDAPYSVEKIEINPSQINNQKIENVEFKITTASLNSLEKKWINGAFLIALPDSIINASINSVQVSDDSVQVQSCDVYEENGRYFIKIYTKNEEEKIYTLTVNASVAGNPLNPTEVKEVKLYTFNENCDNYYSETRDIYDLDSDGNTNDNIGYSSVSMTLIAPSGLLTTEYVTNYDDENNVTIAPNIADIEKSDETRTADINVSITNGYSGTISDIIILGRTPFEGNEYVLNGGDLNSKFTANMTGAITVPNKLQEYANVYYSIKENANKDLTNTENEWKTAEEVTDWSQVRSYLIDLQGYTLEKEEEEVFNYEVNVPAGLGYNSASFSDHAVYYNLDTENGKLAVQTEPNKVGIQVVSKYSIQLTKNKKAHDNVLVSGATYRVKTEDVDGNEISKTATTNENGVLTLRGLYVDREYTLKEISTPTNYALSNDEIKFKAKINENDELEFEIINGQFKQNPEIAIDENGNYVVNAKVEDEAKYTLVINKKDENGDNLAKVRFLIKGSNINKIIKTDEDGKIIIKGLNPNEEYKLQEVESDGYYVDAQKRTFIVERNVEGNLSFRIDNDERLTSTIEENDDGLQALLTLDIENEKIPTYDLQILKVEENYNEQDINNLEALSGAHFLVESIDTGDLEEYITNSNGLIELNDLYIHKEGKYITGEYVIKETKAPNGYSNNAEEIHLVVSENSEGILEANIENKNQLTTYRDVIVEGNIVKIVLQDKPLFKLIKIDPEIEDVNQRLLANAEFVIYELDENGNEIDFAKDVNGDYVGTLNEDGKYIVKTNERGEISLPLRGGLYKAVEVTYPEGYQEYSINGIFEIEDKDKDDAAEETEYNGIIEIEYIEDLVDFANNVNNGNNYSGYLIKLKNDLDFNESSSYRNASSTSYGDLNGDSQIEDIKTELTKTSGKGFTPIAGVYGTTFSGCFDGCEKEIKNFYRNDTTYGSLFSNIENATIKNLTVSGTINCDKSSGMISTAKSSKIVNCTNKINLNGEVVGGIASVITNCTIKKCSNYGTINGKSQYYGSGGIIGQAIGTCDISYCTNYGSVTNTANAQSSYAAGAGGIIGFVGRNTNTKVSISNCINKGYVSSFAAGSGSGYAGGIIGRADNDLNYTNISNCYNDGKIYSNAYSETSADATAASGGIVGYGRKCIINSCYNKYEIVSECYCYAGGTRYIYCAGIIGYLNAGSIKNCYNTCEIKGKMIHQVSNKYKYLYTGGIAGQISSNTEVANCYNTNDVYNILNDNDGTSQPGERYCRGVVANSWGSNRVNNNYYLDSIEITSLSSNSYSDNNATSDEEMKSLEFYTKLNVDSVWAYKEGAYPILTKEYIEEVVPTSEITISNTIKKYKITTEVENGIGGSISGKGDNPYETVIYNQDSTKEIIMIPDEGYIITKVTVNGEEIDYKTDENGKAIISSFKNMKEDKHVVVTYSPLEQSIVINKVDENDNTKMLPGAKFNIQQQDQRPEITNEMGELTANGSLYNVPDYNQSIELGEPVPTGEEYLVPDYDNEIEILKPSSMTINGRYYFLKSGNRYVSNNSWVSDSVANSYVPIDLSEKSGTYKVKVNAEISSQANYDIGYATITETTTAPNYSNSYGRFIYISGSIAAQDYITEIQGGKKYYLHLGYRKNGSTDQNSDSFTVNSIQVINSQDNSVLIDNNSIDGNDFLRNNNYYFERRGNYYQPNNYYISSQTTANSILRIDLTNYEGEYVVEVEAHMYNQSNNTSIGYANITQNGYSPSYTSTEGQFINIKGNVGKKKYAYKNTLIGGRMYYLHIGYKNDTSYKNDQGFCVDGVKVCKLKERATLSFEKNGESYTPNNLTYDGSRANSYIPIDLTNKEGKYVVVLGVNGTMSSSSVSNYLYATVTKSVAVPEYNQTTGRFLYVYSVGGEEKKYTSMMLEGGSMYYLHLGFINNNPSLITSLNISNIKLCKTKEESFCFENIDGKYVSNNHFDSTQANSYIPIDLRNREGKYNLKINAECSSEFYDSGYATITNSTDAPSTSTSRRIIYAYGTTSARDYTTILDGGEMYYLHFGYYKNASGSYGTDNFTINSVELSLNGDDLFYGEFETNTYGQIREPVPIGKYEITELEAPEGYILDSEPRIVEIGPGQDNAITITNKHKTGLLIHHYYKDNTKEGDEQYTTLKVAEDEFQEGDVGQGYTTSPRFDLDSLYLEKDEDDKYVIPGNAIGAFGDSLIEVNYYYELKPIELKINHYLDGTETALVDEKKEEYDSTITFNDDGTYQISTEGSYEPNSNEDYLELIANKYELVKVESSVSPEVNVDDTFNFYENSELRYYYKLKEHKITTEVKEHIERKTNSVTNEKEDISVKGGQISGEDDSPYEVVSHEENSKNEITATPDAGYRIAKIILESGSDDDKTTTVIYDEENESENPAEIKYVKNPDGSITLKGLDDTSSDLFSSVTEDKHIIVEFAPEQAKIIVHHYLEGTGEEFGTEPVRVLTTDGVTEHEDDVRYDFVDEPYATKPSEKVNKRYKYVSSSDNTSGKYTDNTIHVYYYYNYDDFGYSIHYFYDGVEKEENMVEGEKVLFGSEITEYPDKPEGYVFNKVEPTDSDDERKTKLTISENEEENVINVYYVSFCEITTKVIEHEEKYSDGTTTLVKGGTISGEDETPYEEVQKYHNSTKDIVITPDDGYEIARVVIKDLQSETETELDVDSFKDEEGSITLNNENGYFINMTSSKRVEVEFSKKTKVTVKYLSVDETDDNGKPLVLAEEVVINGKQDDEYSTQRKVVTNYITAKKELEDGTEASETYENSDGTYTKYDQDEIHKMYADDTTIIYWYKKLPRGNIIVRHIEIDESDVKDGLTLDSGKELDVEMYSMEEILDEARQSANPDEPLEAEKVINRKTYTDSEYDRAYVNVNGPTSSDEKMQIVSRDDSQHTVTVKEEGVAEEVIEVRFYYERQYKITTKVQPHTEIINGVEEQIKGGSISGNGMSSFELVNRMGSNKKSIIATPGEKYRIKYLTINDKQINLADVKDEDGIASLVAGYFNNMTEDKHIVVEYEKIPARVTVKYLEDGTENELSKEIEINGLIDDEYKTYENEIEGYELVTEKYPTNKNGKMTKEDIVVIYYYRKVQETPVQPEKETENNEQEDIQDNEQNQIERTSTYSVKTGDNEVVYLVAMTIASIVMLAAIIAKRM